MGTHFVCYCSIGSVFVLSARGRKVTNEFMASLLNLFWVSRFVDCFFTGFVCKGFVCFYFKYDQCFVMMKCFCCYGFGVRFFV